MEYWNDLTAPSSGSIYSETSDNGHSERGQTSQQRTHHLYSSIHNLYKITSERGQPLYKGQTGGSQWCPLFGGSTVIISQSPPLFAPDSNLVSSYVHLIITVFKLCTRNCRQYIHYTIIFIPIPFLICA